MNPASARSRGSRLAQAPAPGVAVSSLKSALKRRIRGEVRFDDGSLALYSTDASNYRQIPIGVVIPKSIDDAIAAIAVCRQFGAPFLSRGGGTSLAGQCCNVAIVADFSKYLNRVLSVDPLARVAYVESGAVLDDLRNQAEKYHLTFGPDPSTHNHCTLGGMIGNNACGTHAQMAGRTSENIHELDILTYDGFRMKVGKTDDLELERIIREGGRRGEIYGKLRALRDKYADLIRSRYPKIPRRISGYNLDELLPEKGFHVARALVGTEGTCVAVLGATVRLVYSPPFRALTLLGYPTIYEAGDHVPEIDEFQPLALEGMDDVLVHDLRRKGLHPEVHSILPEGKGWLLVELGGATQHEANERARKMMAKLASRPGAPSMKLYEDKSEETKIWKIRESGLGATARTPGNPDTWEGWEDSAVPPENLGIYLRKLRELFQKYEYGCSLYGHFGQACVHTRIDFDLLTEPGIEKFHSFLDEASTLVVSLGGSLSGEHGDGQSKAEFLPKMFGPELVQAFREFKSIWDPEWKMNPGKIVDAYLPVENLRLGPSYNPPEHHTHFQYPDDKHNIAYATLRCVGVGECRRMKGGTMCPSYRATKEERHSTRGRAHILNEMLRGDSPVKDGWKSEAAKEALDLCLACKGCKNDCPVNVDMATYKAEFLSHYYEGRPRPVTAYSMGLIDIWAELASLAPGLANFFTQTPGLSGIAKALAGIAPQRKIPKFADRTFKQWFQSRKRPLASARPSVILWADTFNNYFHPKVAIAAVEVLETAGFHVIVLGEHLCCGRPLYDFGMLDLAKKYLQRALAHLKPYLEAGTPIVGLEPSCVSVFRDELREMMPADLDARRLRERVFLLSEFLEKFAPDFLPPPLHRRAVVHGHCHQKAVLNKLEDEKKWFKKLGLEANVLDSGCCGMAGSFGFENEADRYEVSMKIGEHELFPTIRETESAALVIADGFSCREQIEEGASRKAMHFAEVVQLALRGKTRTEEPRMKKFDIVESYGRALEDAGVVTPFRRPAKLTGWLLAGGALTLLTLFQVRRKWRG